MFRPKGRRWLEYLFAALFVTAPSAGAAQEYKGPISMVVGYPAGGSADIAARILADRLPPLLGQPVVVENRAGAGGQIAARYVKDAPANGSVLFFSNSHTMVTVPLILKAPGFDPLLDLKPVAGFAEFEQVLVVHPSVDAASYPELLAYFASHPDQRNIAVPAPGSTPEFAVGRLSQIAKLDIQPVAYRGSAPATQDVVGGQVKVAFLPVADVLQYVRAGKLRALAVTHVTPLMPGIPAFAEIGLSELAEAGALYVYAPAKMSDEHVRRISGAILNVAARPDVRQRLLDNGLQVRQAKPDELRREYTASRANTVKLMRAVNYQPQ